VGYVVVSADCHPLSGIVDFGRRDDHRDRRRPDRRHGIAADASDRRRRCRRTPGRRKPWWWIGDTYTQLTVRLAHCLLYANDNQLQ